jgi:hypothetical protein
MRVAALCWIITAVVLLGSVPAAGQTAPSVHTRLYVVEMRLFWSEQNAHQIQQRRRRLINLVRDQQVERPANYVVVLGAERQFRDRLTKDLPSADRVGQEVEHRLSLLDREARMLPSEVAFSQVLDAVQAEIDQHAKDIKKRYRSSQREGLPLPQWVHKLSVVFIGSQFFSSLNPPKTPLDEERTRDGCRVRLHKPDPEQVITAELHHPDGHKPEPELTVLLTTIFREQLEAELHVYLRPGDPPVPAPNISVLNACGRQPNGSAVAMGAALPTVPSQSSAQGGPPSVPSGATTPSLARPPAAELPQASTPPQTSVTPPPEPPSTEVRPPKGASMQVWSEPDPSLQGGVRRQKPPPASHQPSSANPGRPNNAPLVSATEPPRLEIELAWRQAAVDLELRVFDASGRPVPGVVAQDDLEDDSEAGGVRRSLRLVVGANQPPPAGQWRVEVRVKGVRDDTFCSAETPVVATLKVQKAGVSEKPVMPRFDNVCASHSNMLPWVREIVH